MSHPNEQPLKILEGIGVRLEVYTDHIMVRRTDMLSKLLPDFFGIPDRSIPFEKIESVRVYSSRFLAGCWMQLFVLTDGRESVGVSFRVAQHRLAHEIKDIIEDLRSRRQVAPYLKTLNDTA